jgi:hypothetical protein
MPRRTKRAHNKVWLYQDAILFVEVGGYDVLCYLAYREPDNEISRLIISRALKGRGIKGRKYAILKHSTNGTTPSLTLIHRFYTFDKAFEKATRLISTNTRKR